MASLNLCSGCQRNFGGQSAHSLHRIGKFGIDRRCMTSEEMTAKGFTVSIEPVKRYRDGKPYTDQLETWYAPMSEQERARLASMRQKGEQTEEEELEEAEIESEEELIEH